MHPLALIRQDDPPDLDPDYRLRPFRGMRDEVMFRVFRVGLGLLNPPVEDIRCVIRIVLDAMPGSFRVRLAVMMWTTVWSCCPTVSWAGAWYATLLPRRLHAEVGPESQWSSSVDRATRWGMRS